MARQPTQTRRTVLTTMAGFAASVGAGSGIAADDGSTARDRSVDSTGSAPSNVRNRSPQPAATTPASTRAFDFETYVATVDRIVDGRYVVLLLEAGGRTVDQLVVSRERLPAVEERDQMVVLVRDGDLVTAWPLPERLEIGYQKDRLRR